MWNVDDWAWVWGHIQAGSENGRSRARTQVSIVRSLLSVYTWGEMLLLLDLFYSADLVKWQKTGHLTDDVSTCSHDTQWAMREPLSHTPFWVATGYSGPQGRICRRNPLPFVRGPEAPGMTLSPGVAKVAAGNPQGLISTTTTLGSSLAPRTRALG